MTRRAAQGTTVSPTSATAPRVARKPRAVYENRVPRGALQSPRVAVVPDGTRSKPRLGLGTSPIREFYELESEDPCAVSRILQDSEEGYRPQKVRIPFKTFLKWAPGYTRGSLHPQDLAFPNSEKNTRVHEGPYILRTWYFQILRKIQEATGSERAGC